MNYLKNVISLEVIRNLSDARLTHTHHAYASLLSQMSKIELLEEMVRFEAAHFVAGRVLDNPSRGRGLVLFRQIACSALTDDLRMVASSYCRHLEVERGD